MASVHPFAETLAERANMRKRKRISMPARKLLKGFGYQRRSGRIVEEIAEQLEQASLSTTLTEAFPSGLDDKVHVILEETEQATDSEDRSAEQLEKGTLQDAARAALEATVSIYTGDSVGAGFVVDPRGLVVTARHVVSDGPYSYRQVRALVGSDASNDVSATVVRSHNALDFALLWLDTGSDYPTVSIGDPRAATHASDVIAIGAPSGLRNTVSRGIVSNPAHSHRGIDYIQTDAAIDPGNSGGPLIDKSGVIGINLWILQGVGAAKFALPVDYLKTSIELVQELGPKAAMDARYCPVCGDLDPAPVYSWCKNCGLDASVPPQLIVSTEE